MQATVIAARIGRVLAVCFGVAVLLWTGNPIHIALAAFIYLAAQAEEAQVLAEDAPAGPLRGQSGNLDCPAGLPLGQPRKRPLATGSDHGRVRRSQPAGVAMALTPIVELGVSEAYAILTEHFGVSRSAAARRHRKRRLGAGLSPQPIPGDTRLITRGSGADSGLPTAIRRAPRRVIVCNQGSSSGVMNSQSSFCCNQMGSAFLAMNSSTGKPSICT